MSNLPPETKALHREVYAGLIAFVVGFFVTLAALEWLMVRLVDPDTRWWQILHFSISAIIISVIGGLKEKVGSPALSCTRFVQSSARAIPRAWRQTSRRHRILANPVLKATNGGVL